MRSDLQIIVMMLPQKIFATVFLRVKNLTYSLWSKPSFHTCAAMGVLKTKVVKVQLQKNFFQTYQK